MTRDPRYDILFEQVAIGPKTMKNRFYQSPHASGFSGDLYPRSEARFREIKAEGGWAVVNTSGLSVQTKVGSSHMGMIFDTLLGHYIWVFPA